MDGLIREVGPTRRLENLAIAREAEEIDASGLVVLPGLVDSHTHLVGGPPRLLDYEMNLAGATSAEIVKAGGGLPAICKTVQDTSGRTLAARAAHVMADCIRQGTTTIAAKSGYGVTESGELKILRAHASLNEHNGNLVSIFLAGLHMPSNFENGASRYLDWLCSYMLPLVRRRNLATFADIVCEEGKFSIADARQYMLAAKDLGFALKIQGGQHWNIGAVKLAVELGTVSIDHVIYVDSEDIELLAGSPTIATLLPGPVFYMGTQRYSFARKLIDRGAAVALATNYNPDTSPSHNMQMILSLACRKMNMTPAEAITASTINGAYALGLSAKIGSIQVGKQADLILLDVADYREIPYHFGVNLVAATMKKGQVIYRASEVQWASSN